MIQGPETYAPRRLASRIAAVYGGSEDEWLSSLRQALSDDALARDMWTKAIVADEAFADTKLDDFRQWLTTVSFDTEDQVDTGERTEPALPDLVDEGGLDDAALLLPDVVPQDATSINVPVDPIIAQDPETFKVIPAGGNTFVPVNAKLAERASVITEAITREDPPEDVGGALEWYRRNVGLPFGQADEADLYLSGYYKDRLNRKEEADVMASITNELGNATAMSLLILSDQMGERADEVNDLLNRALQGDQQATAQLIQLRDSDPLVAEYLRAYEASAKVARLGQRVKEDYADELAEVERQQVNGWAQDVRYSIWGNAPVIGPPATMYFKVVRPAVSTAMRFGSNLLGSTALIIENLRRPFTGPIYGPDTDFREYISRIGNPERYSWLATPATESVGIVREVVELDPDHYVALNDNGKPAYVMDGRGVPYHPEKAKEILDSFDGDFNTLPRRTAFDWGSVLPTAVSGLTETVLIGYLARGLSLGRVSPLAERLSIAGAAFMSSYNAYYEEGLRQLGPLRSSEANAYALGAALGEGVVEAINPLEARITAPSPKSVMRTLRRSSSVEGLGRLSKPSPGTIALGRLRNAAQQGLFESFEGVASQLWGTGIAAAVNATALQDSFKRLDSDVSFTELMNAALSEGLGALIGGGTIAYHPSATHIEALLHVDRNRAVLDYIDKRDPQLGETVRKVLDRADAMAKREAPAGLRERAQQLVQAHGEVVLGKAAEEAAAFAEEAISNAAPESPKSAGIAELETQRAMFLQGRPGAKVRSRGGVEYELVRTETTDDGERRYVIRVDGESTIIMGEADYVRSVNDLFDEIIVANHGNEGLARAQEIRGEVEAVVRAGEEVAAASTRAAEEEEAAAEEDDDVADTVDPFDGGAPTMGGASTPPAPTSPSSTASTPEQGNTAERGGSATLPSGDATKAVQDVADAAAQGLLQDVIDPVIEMANEGDAHLDNTAILGAQARPAIEAQGVDTSGLSDDELGQVLRDIAQAEARGAAVDVGGLADRINQQRKAREEEARRREEERAHRDTLREEATAFVADNGAELEVVVASSYDELSPEDRADIAEQAFDQMEAAVIPGRGRLIINANNVRSRQRLREVMLHEVVAHYGLRAAFGDALEDALQGIVQSKKHQPAIKAIMDRYKEAGVELSETDAAEELVAMMAERDPQLGLVQRVIAAIRQALRRMGLVRQYTDQDIIYSFILPARQALRNKAIKDPRRRARAAQRERARFAMYWHNRLYREEFARREKRMEALHAELNEELNRRKAAFDAAVRRLREAGKEDMIDSVRAVFEEDVAALEQRYRRRFEAERTRFDERVARIAPGVGIREGFASVTMGDVLASDFPMTDERPAAPGDLTPLVDRLSFYVALKELATGRPVEVARKEMRGLIWRHLPDEKHQAALRGAVADVARELGLPPMEVVFASNYFDIPEEARYRTPVDLIMDAVMIVWDGKLYIMDADKVHVDDVRYFMVRDAILRSGLALALGPELGDALDALFHNALFHDEVVRTAEHYGLDLSTPFRRQMATQLALIESYLRDGQLLPTGSHGFFDTMRRALRRLGLVKERSMRDLMEDLVLPAMAALDKPAGSLDRRWRELGDRNTNARFSLFNAIPETIDVDGVQRPTRNSEGDLIYEHVEGIRAFWRWFGDSKVVDDEGRPLVLYHAGTFNPFAAGRDVFEPRLGGIHFGTYKAAYDRAVLKYLVPDETAAFMEKAMRFGEVEVVDEDGELWMEPYDYALEVDKDGNLYVRHFHDDSRELVAHADEYHLPKGVLPTDRLLFVRRPDVRIYPYYLRIENPIDVADHGNDEGWAMALRDMRRQGGDGLAYVNEVEDAGDYSYVIPSSAQAKLARGNYGWFRRDDPRPRFRLLWGKKDDMPSTINIDGIDRPTRDSRGNLIHHTEEGIRAFWRWFGDSKTVDKKGRPIVFFHGTVNDFTEFKDTNAPNLLMVGDGIYASTSPRDSYYRYSNPKTSPYLAMKVEMLARDLANRPEYKGRSREELRSIAEDEIIGERAPRLMPLYVRARNPVYFDYTKLGQPTGAKTTVLARTDEERKRVEKVIRSVFDDLGDSNAGALVVMNLDKFPVLTAGNLNHEMSLLAVFDNKEHDRRLFNKAFPEIMRRLGYDTAISLNIHNVFEKYVRKGDMHVTAFERNGVKSAIGNVGTFSDDTADVRYSLLRPDQKTIMVDGVERPTRNSEGMPIHFTIEGITNFWRWFGDSKVVDDEGRPLVLYHAGTFDPYDHETFAEMRNGIHFGTQQAAIERLFSKWAGRPILMPEKVGGETMLRIQPVTVDDRLERAFYVKPGEVKETFIDDDGSIMVRLSERRGGKVVRVMAPNTYVEVGGDLPGLYVSRHYDVVHGGLKVGVWAYYLRITNPTRLIEPSRRGLGVDAWEADIAEARAQGHDGAVYSNDYEDYGSESWIAFSPEQVKAATINTGAFSPTDARVRYSLPPHVAAAAKAGAPLPQGRPPRWAHRYGHLREGVGLYERAEPIVAALMSGAAPQHPVDREHFEEYEGWRAHADDVVGTVTGTKPARVVALRRFDRPRHLRSAVLVADPAVTEPQANGLSLLLTASAPRWHGGADVMVVDGPGTGPVGELVFVAVESIRGPQATALMRRVNRAIQAAAKEAGTQIDVELMGWNGGARGGMVAFTAATPEARQMVLTEMRAAGLKPTFVTRAALHHHGKSRHTDTSAVRGHDDAIDGMADVAETMAQRHLDPTSLLADDPFVRNNMMAAAMINALTRKGLTADEAIEAASALTGIPKAAMRAFYHHVQNIVEMRRSIAGRLVRLPLLGTLLNRYLRYKANLPEEVRHLDMLRRGSREYTLREAADLSKRLEEMLGDDERLRALAADYLEGNVRREHFDTFTESQRKTLDDMRTLIDRLSVALLTGRGTANPAVLDNIGKHLTRVYGIFLSEDRGGLPAIIARLKGRPTLEDFAFDNLDPQVRQTAIDEMVLLRADKYLAEYAEYVKGGGTLSEAQYMRKRAEEELRLILNKYQVNDAPFAGAATDKRSIDTSLLRRRKALPPALRKALGEVEDVVGRFYYTVYHMSLSAYNAMAMHTIASIGAGTFLFHPDIHTDIPAEYSYPIAPSGSGPWRPLAGWYTSKDIRNDLRDSLRIVHDIGDWLYGLMRRAAAFVNWHNTVGSIPTQARNFVGNFEYVLNNGWLSPTDWYDVARWLAGKDGRTNIIDSLVKAAQQFNVVGQNIDINVLRTLTEHKPDLLFKAVVLKSRGTPVSKAAKVLGVGQDLLNTMYRVGDDFFKMLGFIVEARRYARAVYGRSYGQLTEAEQAVVNNYAANVVKSLLPNYDAIGKVQRVLAVNPLIAQFTTFQFEALRTWHNYWTLIAYEWSQGGRMRELAVRRMAWWAATSAMRRGLTAAIAKGASAMVVGWFRHVAGLVGGGGDEDEDKLVLAIRHMMPQWADDRTLVPLFWSGYRLVVYDMNSVEPSARVEEFLNILSDRPAEEWPRQMLSNMADFVAPTITTEMFIDAKEEWERLRTLPVHQRVVRVFSDIAVRSQGTLRAFVSAAKKSESGQEMVTKLGLKAMGFNTYEIDPVMHIRRLLSSLFDYQNGDIARVKRQAKKEIMRAPTPEAKEAIRQRTEEYIRSRLDMLIKEVELARTFVAAVPDPEARERAEMEIRDALMGGYLSRMEKAYVFSGGESEFIFYVRGQ